MKMPAFQLANLQGFLLRHVEKIVVAILGIVALAMIWGGVHALLRKSVQPNQTPEAIKNLTTEAVGHIDTPKEVTGAIVRPTGQLAKALEPWRPQQLKLPDAPPSVILSRPFTDDVTKRPNPQVFPIEDLRAVAGIAVLPDAAALPMGEGGASADKRTAPRPRPRPGQPGPEAADRPGGDFAPGVPQDQQLVAEVPGKVMPYVIVTGLVPAAKQRKEFARCFAAGGAPTGQQDVPRWGQYWVERTAASGSSAGKWERMKVAAVQAFAVDGGAAMQPGAPEQVQEDRLPPAFLLGPTESEISFVAGLPQLLYDSWGANSVHPWFLPELRKLMDQQVATAAEPKLVTAKQLSGDPTPFLDTVVRVAAVKFVEDAVPQPAAAVFAQKVSTLDDSVSFPVADVGPTTGLVFVRTAPLERELAPLGGITAGKACDLVVRLEKLGRTPVARVLSITFVDPTGAADGETVADPNPFPLQPIAMGNEIVPGELGPGGVDGGSEFRLFRFLDRTVKPGVAYRYRVRFAILNPNYEWDPRLLEDPGAAKSEILLSEASNETAAVTVPDPTLVMVRTLSKDDAKSLKLRKDTVELLVLGPRDGTGNYRFSRVITEPGGVVNADPTLNSKTEIRVRGDTTANTERTLIDLRGRLTEDDPAKSGPREMVEALLLRRDGSLEVVSYADSQPMFDRYRHTLPPITVPGDDPRTPRSGSPNGGETAK